VSALAGEVIPLGARYRVLLPTRPRRDAALRFLAGISPDSKSVGASLRLLRESAGGRVAIAFEDGGLLQWLDAWHNAVLPADFHAAEAVRQARRRARGIFAALGQDPDAVVNRPVDELSLLETRLVGFVKAMLLEPDLLVLDCLFERLGFEEQRRVRTWIEYCQARYPMRRMLYLGLAEVAAGLLEGFAEMSAGGDQA
jgi:ABC-type multidrug transport system ATPase subunit